MSNRLSHLFSRPPCRCVRIRKRLRRLAAECNQVEQLIGNVAEFIVPSVASYLSGDRRTPRLFLSADFEPAKRGADLGQYAAGELRRVGLELLAAANRLEGGAA